MNTLHAAQAAKKASIAAGVLNAAQKNKILLACADALLRRSPEILAANKIDMELAEKTKIAAPLIKRLLFNNEKLTESVQGIRALAVLPDPVGKVLSVTELDLGLTLEKVSCPIGVIGVIFESRPDALIQIASLCLKSGNAVLLKGGAEARETNKCLAGIIQDITVREGMPMGWCTLLENREEAVQMLSLHEYIDMIIPRGSNEFVRYIMNNTKIPVLGHADGICHVYFDDSAETEMSVSIARDSKCQYTAVCNAAETFLVHEKAAKRVLPPIARALSCTEMVIRGCSRVRGIINAEEASEQDWRTEYLDSIISIKIVHSLEEAVSHINTYGSGHTDSIVSADADNARQFMREVRSANVFWNCSTRFSDGYRYGLGAEVGVSTSKLHARGPVGLEGLTIYKWLLSGSGHIVADYVSGAKKFIHKKIL